MKTVFYLAMALIVLVSPVFVTEEMSIWNFPYVIYFFCLFISACAPIISFKEKPQDNLFILGLCSVILVILAIPALFSCYREVHLVFLAIGGIGAILSFGVSMLRIKLQKKCHKA